MKLLNAVSIALLVALGSLGCSSSTRGRSGSGVVAAGMFGLVGFVKSKDNRRICPNM